MWRHLCGCGATLLGTNPIVLSQVFFWFTHPTRTNILLLVSKKPDDLENSHKSAFRTSLPQFKYQYFPPLFSTQRSHRPPCTNQVGEGWGRWTPNPVCPAEVVYFFWLRGRTRYFFATQFHRFPDCPNRLPKPHRRNGLPSAPVRSGSGWVHSSHLDDQLREQVLVGGALRMLAIASSAEVSTPMREPAGMGRRASHMHNGIAQVVMH